ncbi:MAG: hypothetical protein HZA90_26355 [Verrucomicrobia bacterium]|nr:hypothetical protein [Verrucomicrobiota bacterium]
MATISSRLFNLTPDKFLVLGNEEWVRKLGIGSDWTKLRLGLLVALTPDGTSNLIGCTFVLGLCSAGEPFSNTVGFARHTPGNPANFLGADFSLDGSSAPAPLTYNAGAGNPYLSGVFWGVRHRAAGTDYCGTVNSTNQSLATNNGTLPRRSPLYLDITKGSPDFTLKAFTPTAAQAVMDFTPAHFLDGLEQPGTPVLNGQTLTAGSTTTRPFSEAGGALDTVNVFWNKSAFPLEVFAVAAYRVA